MTMFKYTQRAQWTPKKKKEFIRNSISKSVMNNPAIRRWCVCVYTRGISIHPSTLFVWPHVAFPWQLCQSRTKIIHRLPSIWPPVVTAATQLFS